MTTQIKDLKRGQLFYVTDPDDCFKVYLDPTLQDGVWVVEATGSGDEAVTFKGNLSVTVVTLQKPH